MNQFIIQFFIWLVSHWQIQPCFFIYNAFEMGEGTKAFFAVITTHTAFPKASERHFAGCQMDDGIVNASAAKAAAGSDLFGGCFCSL